MDSGKEAAIQKIMNMSQEQAAKVLIFIAGMEAERDIRKRASPLTENGQDEGNEGDPSRAYHTG